MEGAGLDYKVELPDFEGPLDLLLHLVKKHELNILDIPIAFITDQYLRMLELMRMLNLDVAGEYLLMAATLAHLKSRELVPPDPVAETLPADAADEEGLDPRQELIRRLLEYQKYKEAAGQLGSRPVTGRNVWPRGAAAEEVAGMHALPGGAPLAEVPIFRLIEALENVLSRAEIAFSHDVMVDRLSVSDAIHELIDRLERERTFTFESCFDFVDAGGSPTELKNRIVTIFLAILELARLRMVHLEQHAQEGLIYVTRATADLRLEAAARMAKASDEEVT